MPVDNSARTYRWSDLPTDKPIALLERQRIVGEKAMISRVVLGKGCVVPAHQHENEQLTCVLSGVLCFGLGPEGTPGHRRLTVSAGEVVYLPSMVLHSAEAMEDSVVLDVFAPPSATTGIDERP